ncbi:autotransporter assembly complex family protein [Thioalkalivibrio sp. XN8]|uniref:autotransporter assembly complex protein TamA n=1 Tax=Thioalkalivibrio sp. XN8 TaxID=2712863 RepID=UPI0013EDD7E2|nr:autotransporter assembly complex family protein [Thioalkalivibrio sp. XN8]NGP52704.1 outer membrane protein assembly factor [Thioalkalivibrio sp. XN8]
MFEPVQSRWMPTCRHPVRRLLPCLLACLVAMPAWGATISVSISGVRPEVESNIRALLDLSRYAEREDLSEPGIRRLYARADGQVREAMQPFGYYRPQISSRLEPENGTWRVVFEIDPGEPVRIAELDVRLEGDGRDDAELLAVIRASALQPGQALFHPDYDRLRASLQNTARSRGYFEAKFSARRLEIDPEANEARVVLHLQTGPRYRFGDIAIDQDLIGQQLLDRVVTLRSGDPYDAAEVLRAQYRLSDTSYFARAIAETGTPDQADHTVPISIATTAATRQRIRVGLGFATDTGPRASLDVDWRRLNRAGHSARTAISVSGERLDLSGRYRIPIGDPLTERLLLRANITEEELGDLTSRRADLGASVLTVSDNDWQRMLFTGLLYERTEVGNETREDTLLIPGGALEKLDADDVLFPRHGYRLWGELRGSHQALGADEDFARLHLVGSRVMSIGQDWRFFLRGEIGVGLVDDLENLPASQRFFAGGDQSVRGYGFNSLGPRDADGNLIGGRHLLFASVEVERRIRGRVALAAFVDAGNALEYFGDGVEASVGTGVNIHTPVGTLRLSVATSITESRGNRYHLSLRPDL